MTWNHIAEIIASAVGLELKITNIPSDFISKYDYEWGCNLFGDKGYDTVFDNSKIKNIVAEFKPSIPYHEGVKEIIDWYSEKEKQVVNIEMDNLMDKMIADYKTLQK